MTAYNKKQIANLRTTAVRSLVGEDGGFLIDADGIVTFDEGTSTFTDEQIQEEMDRILDIWNSTQYQRDRQYPSIPDQLDKIYHEGIDAWKADIKAVKDEYPKP